ncbi:hypothetical protein V2J09_017896 [Rumex salicifolius]
MSWLTNPFKSLQFYGDGESLPDDASGGRVKEDLSEIGETISRQLRGVAAFLSPLPASSSSSTPCSSFPDDSGDSMSPTFAKIRSDIAELGGSFKSSLSLLSTNRTVSEFSKMACNFMQLDGVDEEEEEELQDDRRVGITDSVIHFVTEISERPECWTDFPLSLNYDFIMSQNQAEHVAVIVDLVPSLAELRVRLSREMRADRLNRDSVDLLSTPEESIIPNLLYVLDNRLIVETRSALLNMLLNNKNLQTTESHKDHSDRSLNDLNSYGEKKVVADDIKLHETNCKRSKEGDHTEDSVDINQQLKDEDDDTNQYHSTKRPYGSGGAPDTVSSSSMYASSVNCGVITPPAGHAGVAMAVAKLDEHAIAKRSERQDYPFPS